MTNSYPIILLLCFPVSCMLGIGGDVVLLSKKKNSQFYIHMIYRSND